MATDSGPKWKAGRSWTPIGSCLATPTRFALEVNSPICHNILCAHSYIKVLYYVYFVLKSSRVTRFPVTLKLKNGQITQKGQFLLFANY